MNSPQPVVINGKRIGKIRASWMLFKETWRFLKADKELVLLPVISLVLNMVLFGIMVAVFVLVSGAATLLPAEGKAFSVMQWAFVFGCYVVGAFSLALGQACVTFTVFSRAHGGNATLGQSLKAGFSHWQSLFIWSLITSTVGILLRIVSERSQLLGKIVAAIIGASWSVLTYFVVPAIVIDKKSAFASVATSASLFKKTWGETLVANISLTLVFLGIHALALLSVIGLSIYVSMIDMPALVFVLLAVYFVWLIITVLVSSTMNGILKTLLYIYASETNLPTNFNQELLSQMLVRTNTAAAVQLPVAK
jgi:hypothetical protein